MILDLEVAEDTARRAVKDGIHTVADFFDPSEVLEELTTPDSIAEGVGQRTMEIGGDVLGKLYEIGADHSYRLVDTLGAAAVLAGFQEWEPNYFMTRVTDSGYRKHPDATSFRYVSFFAYLFGETHLLQHTESGVIHHKANAGGLIAMRQSMGSDTSTRVIHSAASTGARAFITVGYETSTPSY